MFFFFLRILIAAFSNLFAIIAVFSMTIGNVMALRQNDIKRLLAYSTIAHAGYLLIGVASLNISGIAFFFSKIMKPYRVYFWLFATIIMFSRIYIGVHYPLDVLAGFIFGIIISKLTIIIWNQLSNEKYYI